MHPADFRLFILSAATTFFGGLITTLILSTLS